jgi:hypothetical protein
MSRIRLKYVQAWVDREGRVHRYFRRPGFPRVRLRGLPGSAEFMAAYQTALAGPRTAIGAGRSKPGSVSAVIAEYFDSQQFFASKSAGTQRMRRSILELRRVWRQADWIAAVGMDRSAIGQQATACCA